MTMTCFTSRMYPALMFLLFSGMVAVEGQGYIRLCRISKIQPVRYVARDESNENKYSLVNFVAPGNFTANIDQGGLRRQLQVQVPEAPASQVEVILIPSDPRDQTTVIAPNTTFAVRECPCVDNTYCPIGFNTCGVPLSDEPAGCLTTEGQDTLLRNVWPLMLLWYSAVFFFLACTEQGRNVRRYMMVKCCKSTINERTVDIFLYTHGYTTTNPVPSNARVRRNNTTANDTQQSQLSPLDWLPIARLVGESPEPTELVLKTRVYQASDHVPDDDDACCCTICFTPLETGDRVGKLSCSHTFHVDCLREWLPRRNVCPLCQSSNAATPRYGQQHNSDNDNEQQLGQQQDEDEPVDHDDNPNNDEMMTNNISQRVEGTTSLTPLELSVAAREDDVPVQPRGVRNTNFPHRFWAGSRMYIP
jgi:Ring finger domain